MTHINLLPWREQRRIHRNKQFVLSLGLSFVFSVIVAAGIWGYLYHSKQNLMMANQTVIENNEVLEITLKNQQLIAKKHEQNIQQLQQVEQLTLHRLSLVELWSNMARVIPESIHLTHLNQSQDALVIKGKASESSQISKFVQLLQRNETLQQVQIKFINNNHDTFDFEIMVKRAIEPPVNEPPFNKPSVMEAQQ